jgi:branched-chain amino acid aminotransferase
MQIIHNNHLIQAPEWATSNRIFRYGDGLFETILWYNGKAPFLSLHWSRLSQSAAYLGMDLPTNFTEDYLVEQLPILINQNQIEGPARIRITLYRDSEGTYKTLSNKVGFTIDCQLIDVKQLEFAESGVLVGLYKENLKSTGPLANIKTTSALLYCLAIQYAQEQGWDDALLLNAQGKIIEATSSNLFLVKGSALHTPPLKEGPLDGVTRKMVFQLAMEKGYNISAGPVEEKMLLEADEIILTNAIQGIRWVRQYGTKIYGNQVAGKLHAAWLERVGQ